MVASTNPNSPIHFLFVSLQLGNHESVLYVLLGTNQSSCLVNNLNYLGQKPLAPKEGTFPQSSFKCCQTKLPALKRTWHCLQ